MTRLRSALSAAHHALTRSPAARLVAAAMCLVPLSMAAGFTNPGDIKPKPCEVPPTPQQDVDPNQEMGPICAGGCEVPIDSGGETCNTIDNSYRYWPGGIYKLPLELDTDPVPAQEPIRCGSTYNGHQNSGSTETCSGGAANESQQFTAESTSNGFQGYNWFQNARPELTFQQFDGDDRGELDLIMLVGSATDFMTFRRIANDSSVFAGTNGNAGVIVETVRDEEDEPTDNDDYNLYTYYSRDGKAYTFFGDDLASSVSAIRGQFWKVTNASGATAHVSDSGSISAAAAIASMTQSSVVTGRAATMFDSAGNKFQFTYTTVGGLVRLASIEVTLSGTSTVLTRADYTYYTTLESVSSVNIGDVGDLKTITKTTYLSPTSGGSPVTVQRTRYFRYYCGSYNATTNPGNPHQIKMVVGAEGLKRYGSGYATAPDDDLKSYADSYVSATELRTTTTYNKDGTVKQVADPKDLKTRYEYDFSGRQIAVISNYTGTIGTDVNRDHDTYVRYVYTKGLMTKMWVDLNGNGTIDSSNDTDDSNDDQVTEYVYGTTKGTDLTQIPLTQSRPGSSSLGQGGHDGSQEVFG